MKLHRLVLTNYRGISHREIDFPDHGVVVVSGANEVGKSSMIEALDLLLEAKDRSAKKEVKQVKPTHADVGAEITAEISAGAYRFVYRKRFHKRAETQLTVLAPRREQLSGDEAHDRVRSMLAETVDLELWQAQRVLQSASTAAVDLSGSDALARALDVAAGEAATLSGAEPLLVDRIDEEYARYFTVTGRPTGEWAAATKHLNAADAEVARCAARVAEVDDAVTRHGALTADVAEVAAQRAQAHARLTASRATAEAVATLRRQLAEADVIADAATKSHTASVAALAERRRLRADVEERGTAVVALQTAVAESVEEESTAREVHEAAEVAAEKAREAVATTQARVESARSVVDRLTQRDESDRLAARVAKIDATRRELDRTASELAGITVTDASMRTVEQAVLNVERAAGQAELASARIELVAAADVSVSVAGEPVTLGAGETWAVNTTADTAVELPGVLTVRVVPGTPAAQTQAGLEAAQQALAGALTAAGAEDVDTARALDLRRRELVAARDRLTATLEAVLGDDTVEHLRARLKELLATQPAEDGLFDVTGDSAADPVGARAELAAAVAAHQQAVVDCETHRKVAIVASKRLGDRSTQACVLREKLAAAQGEHATATTRLEAHRAQAADDTLAVAAEADGDAARAAAARAAEVRAELERSAPDAVAAALADATRGADALGRRHDALAEELREVSTQLKVYGTEGRRGSLDAAEAERQHAEREYLRLHRRARAAQLLRTVMARHRDATRSRYVDPFRDQVERLGRIVFGDSFEVEVDSDLRICSRTLAGRTVPYESLSGGAREQLGIVARLAGAVLVAKEDGVPLLIDDALGFTDRDRLVKMGAVFDVVGGDGQVIVLTCDPQRYAAIGGAHHIELVS
ncbi:AAA family ATPase [Mycobacterium sp. CPCC 205372]|uniref:AAA family ATPase n=1 Tax=Mycobacterium hippophais TaxID=3016340 RepID=A0ABT4PL68_9MYCO|nr:AAA family ATPase [Mycobacterium hippophais]MCZ8377300.1 AAA family ATPase [Mycobacterium hippophais]